MPETNGNAAAYFVDRHRTGPVAAKAAFIEAGPGGRTITYQDLALQSDRMAALYERHGLRAEDRAAMLVLDRGHPIGVVTRVDVLTALAAPPR